MCGFGSDGAAALLSARSFVCCCSHHFIFPCIELLFQSTPPLRAISRKALPGHSVDVDSLHVSYADIFVSQVRAACGSSAQSQLTVEDVFWNATILHKADMTKHRILRYLSKVYIMGRPARDRTSALVTFSCQDITRIRRMLLRWNELSLLSCPAYIVHVSLP